MAAVLDKTIGDGLLEGPFGVDHRHLLSRMPERTSA
jgi:hypothetical protein